MTATTIASINEVNALLAGTAVSAIKVPTMPRRRLPPAAARRPRRRPSTVAAKSATRSTLDGRTMKADAGTITVGQVKRISELRRGQRLEADR